MRNIKEYFFYLKKKCNHYKPGKIKKKSCFVIFSDRMWSQVEGQCQFCFSQDQKVFGSYSDVILDKVRVKVIRSGYIIHIFLET